MGLIYAQQTPPPEMPDAAGQPEQSPADKAIRIQKISLAAQKLMYDESTRGDFMKMLHGDDVVQIAANAATNVMLILIKESGFEMNKESIIPAGVVVIGDILDFLEQSKGFKHTEAQVEDAIEAFVKQMMSAVSGTQATQVQPEGVLQ